MSYAVDAPITDTFILRDNADAALTGKVAADFATLEAYALTGGFPTATTVLTEVGAGEYAVTFTPTVVATWTLHIVYDDGAAFREFSQTYAVETVPLTVVGTVTALGETRQTLRRMVGKRIPGEQFVVLVATAGGTTSFTDEETLQGPTDAYKGGDLYLLSGANAGKQRRVISSTNAGQLNWQTPVATAVLAGDGAELWNLRGIGVKATEVNDAINDAIAYLRRGAWLSATASVVADFDGDTPTVAIPAALTRGIYAIDYRDPVRTGIWREIDGGGEVPRVGWWYDRAGGTVVVSGDVASRLDGYTLRMRGYQKPGLLAADTDTTPIDAEAVVTEATKNLLVRNRSRNPEFDAFIDDARAEAQIRRAFSVGRKAPNTVVFD